VWRAPKDAPKELTAIAVFNFGPFKAESKPEKVALK